MSLRISHPKTRKTIGDFGEQWLQYRGNEGFYGSPALFSDILEPLLSPDHLKGCRVAEIGSGTGRIVNMLLEAGAKHIIAIEPSDAFKVLSQNIRHPEKVTCIQATGDQLPVYGDLDYVLSVGVLHHIPDPKPVVEAAFRGLRPGGRLFVWVYGKEGNELYLALIGPLRLVTKRLPHFMLAALVRLIDLPLVLYMKLCQRVPLPLREYIRAVLGKMDPDKRRLIIYDQLNPSYAKYYTRFEAEKLLLDASFGDVQTHHRHGYSWSVIGTKPDLMRPASYPQT
jgi:SAM-dependent methyltransferase